jgi:hypothetical protein
MGGMGKRRTIRVGVMLALAGVAALTGCTLVTDVSDFEREPPEDAGADADVQHDADVDADTGRVCAYEADERRDLVLRLTHFSPHLGDDMEFRVVTRDTPPVQVALGRVLPLDEAETLIEMPGAIPPGSFQIDFYADVDGSGDYTPAVDGTAVDHSWSREPCVPEDSFRHNFVFQHLETPNLFGSTARVRFVNMPLRDVRFEMRVIEESTGATVGMVRLPGIDESDFELEVAGIIDGGFTYRVAFYIDLNGNGAYDPPPVDEAWEITGIAGGVDLEFEYDDDPGSMADIGF